MNFSWMLRQVGTLARANLKTRYRQSFAGFLWVILNPLIIFSAQAYVFAVVLNIGVKNYVLLFFCGLLPWIFLASSVDSGATILQNLSRFIKGMPVHPVVFVLAHLIDALINFIISLIVVAGLLFFILRPEISPYGAFYFFIALTPWILFTGSMTFLISVLQVTYRDTRFVLAFLLQVLFFLTPIIYPAQFVPEHLRWTLNLNPLYHMLRPLQFVSRPEFNPSEWAHQFIFALEFSLVVLALTVMFWRWKRDRFYAQL